MRGEVLSIDENGHGLISGDDGARYSFSPASLMRPASVRQGAKVDFLPEGDVATGLVVLQPSLSPDTSSASGSHLPAAAPRLSPWGHFVRCSTTAYFDGNGRASMTEYWSFVLIHLGLAMALVSAGFAFLAVTAVAAGDEVSTLVGVVTTILAAAFILMWLYFIIPSVTALIRRLHDMGQSGFWVLISFVPFGGIVLLIMSLCSSQPGPNAYGHPPC